MKNKIFSSSDLAQKPLLGKTKNLTFFSHQESYRKLGDNALNSTISNHGYLPSSSTVISKSLPPSTKQWMNSVYSFNKNFTKSLPSVDIIVTKIMKGFFTINPLANNPGGKKSRLVQRRFKRLSLNRIFVSKPEIKHSNNKVFITVYLFNKKKRSLLHKLKDLYENITYKAKSLPSTTRKSLSSSKSFLLPLPFTKVLGGKKKKSVMKKPSYNNYKLLDNKAVAITKSSNSKNLLRKGNKILKSSLAKKSKLAVKTKGLLAKRPTFSLSLPKGQKAAAKLYKKHKRIIGKSNSLFRVIKKPKLKRLILNNKHKYKYRLRNRNLYVRLRKGNYINSNTRLVGDFNKKVVNYKMLNLSLKNKISKFILSLNSRVSALSNSSIQEEKQTLSPSIISNILLKNYYSSLNKYKLYNIFNFNQNKSVFSPQEYKDSSTNAVSIGDISSVNKEIVQVKPIFTLTLPKKSRVFLYDKNGVSLYKKNRVFFGSSALKKILLGEKGTIPTLKRGKINASMHKLNALYRLFTIYSTLPYYKNTSDLPSSKTLPKLSLYSSILLQNTYKLLKRSVSFNGQSLLNLGHFQEETRVVSLKKGRTTSKPINANLSVKGTTASTGKEFLLRPLTSFLYLYNQKKLNKDKARRR
jgi:hypothetical protein